LAVVRLVTRDFKKKNAYRQHIGITEAQKSKYRITEIHVGNMGAILNYG
jgi:hypothetical protein